MKKAYLVGFDALSKFPMPNPTKSFVPIRHDELAKIVKDRAVGYLGDKGYNLRNETYKIAKGGNHVFGVLSFGNGDRDLHAAVGFRSSYDKSLAVGLAAGARVVVCENLMFAGEVLVFRRHTTNLMKEIDGKIDIGLQRAFDVYQLMAAKCQNLKATNVTIEWAKGKLSELWWDNAINTTQLLNARRELEAEIGENELLYHPITAMDVLNHVTNALKDSSVRNVIHQHELVWKAFESV